MVKEQVPFVRDLSSTIRPAHALKCRPSHITVCICTFHRPQSLHRLLDMLIRQHTVDAFTFSIVVADNDAGQSAKEIVAEFSEATTVDVDYFVEPEKNIALVRNKAIEHARGEFIAFIDDDEFPVENWLLNL